MSKKILYYSSTTCVPCKVLFPRLETFAQENGIEIEKVMIDDLTSTVPKDLLGVPSVDLFDGGEYLGRLSREAATVKNVQNFLGV